MMHHTRAVILKKEEWREVDLLVTALTSDFGKIRLLAQGSRKHAAKLQGHLEPGSISDISFVVGRNGYRLTTSRLDNFFPGIRISIFKSRALAIMIKLLDDNLLEESRQAKDIFGATSEVLSALERAGDRTSARRLVIWFHLRFIGFLGLLPSPLSPEGCEIRSLLFVAECPVLRLDSLELQDEILEKELRWLIRTLSSAFKTSRLPVALADSVVL